MPRVRYPASLTTRPTPILWSEAILYGISRRFFLNEPWRWPELWSVNPDVRDPNLIYPGDVLYLQRNNGKPGGYLTSAPRAGVTKWSPKMRSEPLTSAIPEIPRNVIDPFIANHRFETTVDRLAYPRVLGGTGGRLISGMADSIYVAGSLSSGVETYDVIRTVNWSQPHIEVPDFDGEVLKDTADLAALSGPPGNDAFDLLLQALGDGHHSAEDLAAALSWDIRAVPQVLAQLKINGHLARQGQAYWTRVRD